jgi:2-polyprenyl-3-methyl-5-hydroxy-6-metoxy-1,4-benzoquinol methylase
MWHIGLVRSTKHEFLNLINANSKVLDLGCGEAGYWESILAAHPNLRLFLYEPDKARLSVARSRVHGNNVSFVSDLGKLSSSFDFIFSFSVLEHVWDKDQFFKDISALLAENGVAVINYDDGHFRSHVYRNRSHFFRIKNSAKTKLGALWKFFGVYSKYQRPVNPQELVELIEKHGLEISHQEYSLFEDFKKFGKNLTESEHDEIYEALKLLELTLNRIYNSKEPEKDSLSIHNDLWKVMMSRTLILKKSNDF